MEPISLCSVPISAAADAVGIHPQTLRVRERKGLTSPSRSPGGDRRYGPDELARISRIAALSAEGLNLEAVRRVLELEAERDRLQAELADLRRRTAEEVARVERQYRRELLPYPIPPLIPPAGGPTTVGTTRPNVAAADPTAA